MDELPDEIVLHVLSYLPSVDLLRCERACARLHELASDDQLWRDRADRAYEIYLRRSALPKDRGAGLRARLRWAINAREAAKSERTHLWREGICQPLRRWSCDGIALWVVAAAALTPVLIWALVHRMGYDYTTSGAFFEALMANLSGDALFFAASSFRYPLQYIRPALCPHSTYLYYCAWHSGGVALKKKSISHNSRRIPTIPNAA